MDNGNFCGPYGMKTWIEKIETIIANKDNLSVEDYKEAYYQLAFAYAELFCDLNSLEAGVIDKIGKDEALKLFEKCGSLGVTLDDSMTMEEKLSKILERIKNRD